MPDNTPDLVEIIDRAGHFLIQTGRCADGLALYRGAAARFPRVAVLHQGIDRDVSRVHRGIGCCAGRRGRHTEAVAAPRTALDPEPDNRVHVNDLGWALYEAGEVEGAPARNTSAFRPYSLSRVVIGASAGPEGA